MTRPERWEIIFSLKTFIAGMLALYIAMACDMQRPYWALTTAYVVSQPFAASSQSKGVFRFGGTLIGAAVAITFGAIFGANELMMLLAVTAWFCVCGYFALLDRSPRSYFFLLAGMTAVLVGWPGGAATIFDTAVARVEEIGLGILCTVLVHSLILPRGIEPVIRSSVEAWARDARRLAIDTLTGRAPVVDADRRKVAADAGRVSMLNVHLRYDTPEHREAARWIDVLQQRMLMLLPVSASIESRLAAVRRNGGSIAGIDAVLEKLAGWIEGEAPKAQALELKRAIAAIEPVPALRPTGRRSSASDCWSASAIWSPSSAIAVTSASMSHRVPKSPAGGCWLSPGGSSWRRIRTREWRSGRSAVRCWRGARRQRSGI